jgi:hypothetical protein
MLRFAVVVAIACGCGTSEPAPAPALAARRGVGAQYLGFWNNRALGGELGGHQTSPLLEVAAKRFGVDITKPKIAGDGAGLLA